MSLNVLIAPSGFKESLGADEIADCIAAGVLRVVPNANIRKVPLVDGGEGFTRALVGATGGTIHEIEVMGPMGTPIQSHFGFLGGTAYKTAVLEMSAAAGLRLVPRDVRDPQVTTTYGVGELIKAALDLGAERILVGCGDSGTNDGGAGMAQALGAQLLDDRHQPIGLGGHSLHQLQHISLETLDPRLAQVQIDVACNWHNILCGDRGVARVFGPQKGASPAVVAALETALERYAATIERDLGLDVRSMNGGGASGGLGAGLFAFLGANLYPRYDIVMEYLELDRWLPESDLVITAEGCIDFQTPRGKIPVEVAKRAKCFNLPVIAIAGSIGQDAAINLEHGIDAFTTILETPCELSEAIEQTATLVTNATERMVRTIALGYCLSRREPNLLEMPMWRSKAITAQNRHSALPLLG